MGGCTGGIVKFIFGYEGMYSISEDGFIFDHRRDCYKKQSNHINGYKTVQLSTGGTAKNYFVHRLVAETFLGSSKKQVNHKDGDKSNNTLENLEYVSNRENKCHALSGNGKYKGVFKVGKKYRARVEVNNKPIHLGMYDSPEEASLEYRAYCKGLGCEKYL